MHVTQRCPSDTDINPNDPYRFYNAPVMFTDEVCSRSLLHMFAEGLLADLMRACLLFS